MLFLYRERETISIFNQTKTTTTDFNQSFVRSLAWSLSPLSQLGLLLRREGPAAVRLRLRLARQTPLPLAGRRQLPAQVHPQVLLHRLGVLEPPEEVGQLRSLCVCVNVKTLVAAPVSVRAKLTRNSDGTQRTLVAQASVVMSPPLSTPASLSASPTEYFSSSTPPFVCVTKGVL